MNEVHLEELCKAFGLGTPVSWEENHEGVLNKNYSLVTTSGAYFIKSVREKRRDSIAYIAAAETFMADGGIPAVRMLKTVDGAEYFEYEDELYTLYPYIEHTNVDIGYDYAKLGALLARIHERGSEPLPSLLTSSTLTEKSNDLVLERLSFFRAQAAQGKEPVDALFIRYIDAKLALLPVLPEVAYESKTLVHGDYHLRNLLFSSDGEVIGVCDWEKADLAPRAFEIARSIQLICFENRVPPFQYLREKALTVGALFLRGYQAQYPISDEELRTGFDLRFRKLVATFWIEDLHYKQHDSRANHFLENEIKMLNEFSTPDTFEKLVNMSRELYTKSP